MQKNKKIVIYIGTLIGCLVVGFFVTKFVQRTYHTFSNPVSISYDDSSPMEIEPAPTTGKTATPVISNTNVPYEIKPESKNEKTVSPQKKKEEKKKVPKESKKEKKEPKKKHIEEIKNDTTAQADTAMVILPPSMTIKEFEVLLNDLNDDTLIGEGSSKVSKSVKITVRNQKEGGKKMRNALDVREKIETGIWKRARVISIGHDEQTGKITSAIVEPIYP